MSRRSLPVLMMRRFSTTTSHRQTKRYKLAIVGGGAGGCSTAAKFANKLGKGRVVVIEPSKYHYYQAMWTFVGAGIEEVEHSARPMKKVLPKAADWIQAGAISFDPENCSITCSNGDKVEYEYLVIAMGLKLDFEKVEGLTDALANDDAVCTNYTYEHCTKTFKSLQNFKEGNALFTFPGQPVKCGGSAQAIMYLMDDYLRKANKRDRATIIFKSTAAALFGVPQYADTLNTLAVDRDIDTRFGWNLTSVNSEKKRGDIQWQRWRHFSDKEVALCFCRRGPSGCVTSTLCRRHRMACNGQCAYVRSPGYWSNYSFLHVVPPMMGPTELQGSSLAGECGFLDVDKFTLQHVKYPNIFGIGDCTNIPTSKTAAAVACQSGVLRRNLNSVMEGTNEMRKYTGYTSCPIVTQEGKCLMTEFDFEGNLLETFPLNQATPRFTMYHVKKTIMPFLYWNMLLKGFWEGPAFYRKMMRLGFGR
ncbi:hypothetical protein ScPMuIL_002681 [Solemya velum]